MRLFILLCFSLFFFQINTKAQKTEKRFSKQIKIYGNAAFKSSLILVPRTSPGSHDNLPQYQEVKEFGFRNISASFSFQPEFGNINEIELSQLSFKKIKQGSTEEQRFTLSLRYEVSAPFSQNFNANHSFKFYFGFFAEPFFQHSTFKRESNPSLPYVINIPNTTFFKINAGPVLRSQYWFSDRFFLDLNVPLTAAFFNASTLVKIRFKADWLFRLGVGMKL